jgi:plasmid stabilization system protein ParE
MKVELNSSVYSDLLEIMEYYDESAEADIAAEFYAEFRQYAKAAAARPYSFARYSGGLRRVSLNRFPYHFLFRIVDKSSIRILVLKHDRREPLHGLDRE